MTQLEGTQCSSPGDYCSKQCHKEEKMQASFEKKALHLKNGNEKLQS